MIHLLGTLRAILLAFALVLIASPTPVAAQIADLNTAINKAGRERMLSQRMAKAYLQIGQGVDAARSQRVLDASIAQFDRQLVELKNYAPSPEIRATYQTLERIWIDYKDKLVGSAPSRSNAADVLRLSDEVLALAHQGTEQLEKRAATSAGRLVNLSGRQRMLSQRMAKLHHAIAWKVGPPTVAADFKRAHKEFIAALTELNAAPANTPALKQELKLASQQWFFFENALNETGLEAKTRATNVATTSERILEVMEVVVGLYEGLQ
jgi:hypothetical protein